MTSLTIKDLAVTTELDSGAMSAVRGGTYKDKGMPFYWGGAPSIDITKTDFSFDATQQLQQSQNTLVNNGNNAAFVHDITANVNPTQKGTNNISFGS